METSARLLRRNPLVCSEMGCGRCCGAGRNVTDVPDDCRYALPHAMVAGDFCRQRRRSGKSTELMRMALGMAANGEQVYFVSLNMDMARRQAQNMARRIMSGELPLKNGWKVLRDEVRFEGGSVKFVSLGSVDNALRGTTGVVVADDVTPAELRNKAPWLEERIVAARWT